MSGEPGSPSKNLCRPQNVGRALLTRIGVQRDAAHVGCSHINACFTPTPTHTHTDTATVHGYGNGIGYGTGYGNGTLIRQRHAHTATDTATAHGYGNEHGNGNATATALGTGFRPPHILYYVCGLYVETYLTGPRPYPCACALVSA